uniref:Envelope protein n=1 Tax=Retroviridae sp. TaxID=2681591 RepID=A0A8K1WIW5_9RETR|nr:MAG: envelope protein [Retroviridae sp.]
MIAFELCAIVLVLCSLPPGRCSSPQQSHNLTWEVISGTGNVVWSVSKIAHPYSWWPDLYPDLCTLAIDAANWGLEGHTDFQKPPSSPGSLGSPPWGGCGEPSKRRELKTLTFYVCPGYHRSQALNWKCQGLSDFYCASWSCETSGDTYWRPSSSWDLIKVTANYTHSNRGNDGTCNTWCHPLRIEFTNPGKRSTSWTTGATWGLRLYQSGYDNGVSFTIKLKAEPLPAVPVGPNAVLRDQPRLPAPPAPTLAPPADAATPSFASTLNRPTFLPSTGRRFLNLLEGAFRVLNTTNPNSTESCWLCFSSSPPYYEGLGLLGNFNNTTSHEACSWGSQKLTLTEVTGKATCLGTIPSTHKSLCNHTLPIVSSGENRYLVPPRQGWWACNTGLTPCVSTSVFNSSHDFCVMVQLVPRLIYHDDSSFVTEFDPKNRYKRELVSLTLATLVGVGIAAGVGTGTAAIIQGNQNYEGLRIAIDDDLKTIEQSITKLEESLTSLSEVVLQNRRGLDLLLLKDGGLCAALREECCFYADHSGIVRDSMSKLRERLDQRKREREASQSPFESWFTKSPWLTTLIPTILGPLAGLLLLVSFGPWALRKLTAFIREQVDQLVKPAVAVHYHRLTACDEESYTEPTNAPGLQFSTLQAPQPWYHRFWHRN